MKSTSTLVIAALFLVSSGAWADLVLSPGTKIVFGDASEQNSAASGGGGGSSLTNEVLVDAAGTDAENGTALINAMANITDSDVTNPYVVRLGPGTYDLGANTLTLKPWVQLIGAHMFATFITGTASVMVEGAPEAGMKELALSTASPNVTMYRLQGDGGTTDTYADHFRVLFHNVATSGTTTSFVLDEGAESLLSNCDFSGDANGSATRIAIDVTGGDNIESDVELINTIVDMIDENTNGSLIGIRVNSNGFASVEGGDVTTENDVDDPVGSTTAILVTSGSGGLDLSNTTVDSTDVAIDSDGFAHLFSTQIDGSIIGTGGLSSFFSTQNGSVL